MTHPDIDCIERTGLTPTQLAHINDDESVECDFCRERVDNVKTCERCGRDFCKDCGRRQLDYIDICRECWDDIVCAEFEMPDHFEVSMGKKRVTYNHTGTRYEDGRLIREYTCEGGLLPPQERSLDISGWVEQGRKEREQKSRDHWKNRKPL